MTSRRLEGRLAPATGSIGGTFWEDFNGDGIRGTNDTGLAGRTIFLDQNQNGQLDSGEASTTTAADGSYAFNGLATGTYYVAEGPAHRLAAQTGYPAAGERPTVVVGGVAPTIFDFNELASTADQTIGPYHKAGFTFDTDANQPTKFPVYRQFEHGPFPGPAPRRWSRSGCP